MVSSAHGLFPAMASVRSRPSSRKMPICISCGSRCPSAWLRRGPACPMALSRAWGRCPPAWARCSTTAWSSSIPKARAPPPRTANRAGKVMAASSPTKARGSRIASPSSRTCARCRTGSSGPSCAPQQAWPMWTRWAAMSRSSWWSRTRPSWLPSAFPMPM